LLLDSAESVTGSSTTITCIVLVRLGLKDMISNPAKASASASFSKRFLSILKPPHNFLLPADIESGGDTMTPESEKQELDTVKDETVDMDSVRIFVDALKACPHVVKCNMTGAQYAEFLIEGAKTLARHTSTEPKFAPPQPLNPSMSPRPTCGRTKQPHRGGQVLKKP
jgi:hypothetical protein